jgi:hypothetical protein
MGLWTTIFTGGRYGNPEAFNVTGWNERGAVSATRAMDWWPKRTGSGGFNIAWPQAASELDGHERRWGGRLGTRLLELGFRADLAETYENTGRSFYNYSPVYGRAEQAGYGAGCTVPGCTCGR